MGWKENVKRERKNQLCYVLTMRDYRTIVRSISQDIDTVTEGLVIETLKRFSMWSSRFDWTGFLVLTGQ
jgi:hypothetical protein